MTSLALACGLNAAHLACGLNAAQSLPSKVARMVAALRRIGGSLWTVENAFSGAFVDNAGTQPVTAVGDLIGKVLDKTGTNHATQSAVACKPSVQRVPKRLGPNLVSNGTFDADLNWTKAAGWTISGGVASCDGSTGFLMSLAPTPTLEIGKTYQASLNIVSKASGTVYLPYDGTGLVTPSVTTGYASHVFTCDSALRPMIYSQAFVGSIDNIAVQEVLEWATVISFDGSNDFLTTGITTGNEGWVCAGVTFADADVTFFSSGTTAANAGVWLYRNGRGAKSMNLAVANGSVIAHSPDIIPPTNTPIVVSGGWTATTVFAGVDHTETSTSSRSGASASVSPLRLGIATEDEIYPLNGLKHAAAYAPVLPDAATRKIIRNGIAALQGRTL